MKFYNKETISTLDDTYLYTLCYSLLLNKKIIEYIRFQKIVTALGLDIKAYNAQSFYTFDKLKKLFYAKKKSNHISLIIGIRYY